MWLSQLRNLVFGRRPARQASRRPRVRLVVDRLEDRHLPSSYTAVSVSDLIADINTANQAGGSNTITLAAGNPFTLTSVNNTTDGATGLPVIAAKDNLTIAGNGDTIARSSAAGTPAFRLFDVGAGASLTLTNLTLQGGLAYGSGVAAEGGAIYSQGALDLNGVTVQNNIAQGQTGAGQSAAGGAIYSSGSLTLEGGTQLQNNQALGGQGRNGFYYRYYSVSAGPGGNGLGGAVYISAGTATLTGVGLSFNTAQGGQGGHGTIIGTPGFVGGIRTPGGAGGSGLGGGIYVANGTIIVSNGSFTGNSAQGGTGGASYGTGGTGGNGFGGGFYAAGGTIVLRNDNVTGNNAQSGPGGTSSLGPASNGKPGLGEGGGLYIATPATVLLDAFTTSHVNKNTATTSNNNIYGTYNAHPILLMGGFPSTITAGVAGSFTVTALDSSGNTMTGYTGTVHISSTDPQAVVTADYPFTAADHGMHTFTATLETAGTQALTVTDKNTASLTATQSGIHVYPAATSMLAVSGFPSPLTAGAAGSFTVTATDAYGNLTGYTGTVAFTSSDAQAGLPAPYTFTSGDGGRHSFTGTLSTAGTQSITATDTTTAGIHGTQSGIAINPGTPTFLRVVSPGNSTAGAAFSITVTAVDAYNNVATNYTGTVSFSSTDSAASLPAPYTFSAADQGAHTFSNGVTLKKAGTQTVTASGTAIPPGLVSWWPGDGNANDIIGGNNGTLVGGVTFSSGEVGQAFSLNGVDGYVNFGSAPAFAAQDFTLDAWVSVDPAQNTGDRRVLSRDDVLVEPDSLRQMYCLKSSSSAGGDGHARLEIFRDGVLAAVTAPSPLTVGFHHLAGTRSGNLITLYVDGLAVASTTTTITGPLSPNSPLVLGQVSPAYNGEFFQGLVDEPDLFNRALSAAEIQWIYSAGSAGKHLAITGSSTTTVSPAAASTLAVTGFPSAAGVSFSIMVAALDAYGNVATGYTGAVGFTSTDLTATLPPDYVFAGADHGVHTFAGIIARKSGTQSIAVTDSLFSSIGGISVFEVP